MKCLLYIINTEFLGWFYQIIPQAYIIICILSLEDISSKYMIFNNQKCNNTRNFIDHLPKTFNSFICFGTDRRYVNIKWSVGIYLKKR